MDVETGAAYFNSAVQMEFQDDEEEINDEDNYADEMEIVGKSQPQPKSEYWWLGKFIRNMT